MEENYDEEDEREHLILSIGDDGKAEIHKESDYVEMLEKDADLIKGFIKENKELFDEYFKKHQK